jgi:hypothetical protein
MTVMELPRLDDAIRDVLAAVGAVTTVFGTRIYAATLAPPSTTYPVLLYYPQIVLDDECLPSGRVGQTGWYFVGGDAPIGVYQTTLKNGLDAVDAALDALRATPHTAGGYRLTTLSSREPVRLDDLLPGGTVSRRLGRSWLFTFYPT